MLKKIFPKKLVIIAVSILVILVAGGLLLTKTIFKDTTKSPTSESEFGFVGSRLETFGSNPGWSIVIPDGWEVERAPWDRFEIIAADVLNYRPGKGLVYTDTKASSLTRFIVSANLTKYFKEDNTYQKSDWQKGNPKGHLYYHEFAKGEKIDDHVMQGGEKEYTYYFVKDDSFLTISYFVLGGDRDEHEFVEKVVSSLKF